MNDNKIDCLGRIQQNHRLNGDFNYELGNCSSSSQYFDMRHVSSNIGNFSQPFSMSCVGEMEDPSCIIQSQNQGQGKSSSTIISRFESPNSAFYATEICMNFPQYDSQVGNDSNPFLISQFSKVNDLEFPLYQCPRENIFLDSTNQANTNFEFSNSNPLQPMMRSQLNSDQCIRSPENSNKILSGNFHSVEQHKFFIDDAASISMSPLIPSKGNQDHKVSIFFTPHNFFCHFTFIS